MTSETNLFGHLRQGDVLNVLVGQAGSEVELCRTYTRANVAILSQTCDVVQDSKRYLLVAPARTVDESEYKLVDKGRKPLSIPLFDGWVADAGRAFSIAKERIKHDDLIRHSACADQDSRSLQIRARIARAFGRFPFPDDIPIVFKELTKRLRHASGRQSNLSKVIDYIDSIRVKANDWDAEQIDMTIYIIIQAQELIPTEDTDPNWSWDTVFSVDDQRCDPESLSLNRICEMIVRIHDADVNARNETSLWRLWNCFGDALSSELIKKELCPRIRDSHVEVLSDFEFTYADYKRTESLDLEALSKSDLAS